MTGAPGEVVAVGAALAVEKAKAVPIRTHNAAGAVAGGTGFFVRCEPRLWLVTIVPSSVALALSRERQSGVREARAGRVYVETVDVSDQGAVVSAFAETVDTMGRVEAPTTVNLPAHSSQNIEIC